MTTEIVRRNGRGQPSKLTPARTKIITDAVAVGMTWGAAAQYAGVSYSSLMDYKRFGANALAKVVEILDSLPRVFWAAIDRLDDEHRTDGQPTERDRALELMLPERERPYLRLWRGIERAVAYFELQNLSLIQEAARGYQDEETTTVTRRNERGDIIETTTTVKRRHARHWQAGAWLLERRVPERYSQVSRHEHAGLGGGPIEVEHTTGADALARMSAAERDARTAEILAIMADTNAIDAEVINDVVVRTIPGPVGNGSGAARGPDDTADDEVHPDQADPEAGSVPEP